jgi:hypothetical protein
VKHAAGAVEVDTAAGRIGVPPGEVSVPGRGYTEPIEPGEPDTSLAVAPEQEQQPALPPPLLPVPRNKGSLFLTGEHRVRMWDKSS